MRARLTGFSRRWRSSMHSPLAMITLSPPARVVRASRSAPIMAAMS
jgi:hypothetical protein